MFWYKWWLDTRWPFLIGLCILTVLAAGNVFEYRAVKSLAPVAASLDTSQVRGPLGKTIRNAIETERDFRGFIWWQWFRQNLSQTVTFFAILLGCGGLFTGSRGGALFTLSLPATRASMLATRTVAGLGELLVLTTVPSLALPLFAPAIGEHFSVVDALVHGLCAFTAAALFFNLAIFLSTVFRDVWRPLLIACVVAVVIAFCELVFEQVAPQLASYGVFHAMSAESYFRSGTLPWVGLLASVLLSTLLLSAAVSNFSRQDI